MSKKIVEPKTIVGLEVGTSKVVAIVGEVLPDGVVNVLGFGSSPAKGIDKGSITDLDAVVAAIQRAIENAESVADCQIMSVTLAITGEHIQSLNEEGTVQIRNKAQEVTNEDIDDAIELARAVNLGDSIVPLHIISQEFAVDKQINIKNPLGMQGSRLKAQIHLIACHQDWLTNLKKAVERCKLKIDQIVFSGLASSYSALTEDEKELGVCLVDIGGGTMDIVVYTNGELRFSKVIPYAGNLVTDDIAYACATSRREAENIKMHYGSALHPPRVHAEKKIEVAGIAGRSPLNLTREKLSLVTSARYSELLGLIKTELAQLKLELERNHFNSELIAGVVLTGGAAQIEDLKECAESVFGMQVRIGSPLNITGLTDYVNKPQYATVLGLLHYEHQNSDEMPPAFVSSVNPVVDVLKKIWNKVKSEF